MELDTTVNGEHHHIRSEHPTAVEVIRRQLGLTGTKLVCGSGSCGACVVQVDGKPVASCLLPAEDLAGRQVTTVEGLETDGGLHPVQRAFIDHDALQCGFCTPGFLTEAAAFCDAWRREHGDTDPGREEVARALAGHLCRCGAYDGIYQAVRAACRGEHDQPGPVSDGRPDAAEKVTGRARYTVDVSYRGMLEGAVVRSTEPHAEILSVDPTPALSLPGVRAYVDLLDGEDRVRYVGAPIGAFAAVDADTAHRAVGLCEVTYRPLPAAVGMDAAEPDAPDVLGWWVPPGNAEMPTTPMPRRGNVRGPVPVLSAGGRRARKAVEEADARSDPLLVQGRWETSSVSHTALEPHAAVAAWEDGDRLTLHLSTQGVSFNRDRVAKLAGVPPEQVRILADHVGGAFGAKQAITEEALAALRLARAADAPVRVVNDRPTELTVGGYRPGARIDLSLLASPDHRLRALTATAYADGGASAGQLTASSMRFVYPGVPKQLSDHDVVSNAPPGKPFRGPIGGPVALWALEQAIDEAAIRLDLDPIQYRSRVASAPKEIRTDPSPDRPLRMRLYEWALGRPLWAERTRGEGRERFRRGVGVAFGSWFVGFDRDAEVSVAVGADATLTVACGAQDLGNGTRAVLARSVADAFGIDPNRVEVVVGDSRLPWGPISSGSRTTLSVVPAARRAALRLQERVLSLAAADGLTGASVTEGGVTHAGERIPWPDLLARYPETAATAARPADPKRPLSPVGFEHLWMARGFTESAHLVQVEVDTRLGRVRPLRVETALAFGRVHAPAQARSQANGAVVQGLGMTLSEQRVLDPRLGLTVTADLDSFRLPGIADTPELDVTFIEDGFEHVGEGGAGMSELAIVAVPAAVGNALADATGRRFRRLPVRPEDVAGEPT